MANICSFSMCVKGKHKDIENFYKAMCQKENIYMGRGAEAEIQYEDEDIAFIDGWCKWSIQSALIDNAISMRTNPNMWYFGESANMQEFEFITLWEACEKWNLDMEVYSEECGCCFQEHYMYVDGNIICDDCVGWTEYSIYNYETKEEAESELNITITEEEWNSNADFISRGGFENWDFNI